MTATPDLAELHAYVDGLLPASRVMAVEEALARDQAAAAQVAAWHCLNACIRAAYTGGTTGPPIKAPAPLPRHQPRLAQLAAAVLLALLVGAAAGWTGRGALAPTSPSAEQLVRETLDAYQLQAVTAEPEALDDTLSTRLGAWLDHDIVVPDLATFDLRLTEAGRLHTRTGAPVVALTYVDPAGSRYALYLIKSLPPDIPAVVPLTTGDNRMLYWPYEEYRCVLEARAEVARLRAIAQAIDLQLQEAEEAQERGPATKHG